MSNAETRAAMRMNRAAVREAEKDMNDPIVQEEILNPKQTELKLSFGTLHLFPLSAKKQRQFHGLATMIIGSALQQRDLANGVSGSAGNVSALFLAGIISRSEQITKDLLYFLAASTEHPGQLEESQIQNLVKEFDEKIQSQDLMSVYAILSDLTGFTKAIAPAKNGEKPPVKG